MRVTSQSDRSGAFPRVLIVARYAPLSFDARCAPYLFDAHVAPLMSDARYAPLEG